MKVAVIGATGNVGSRIVTELLRRGHEVIGVAPHPGQMPHHDRLTARQGDVNDQGGLAQLLSGHDAVISAIRFVMTNPRTLIAAVKQAGATRLLVVGGAGSLEVARRAAC